MSGAHILPFGPVSFENPWIDNFTYEEVKESHCVAQLATKVCQNLIDAANLEGKKFLAVCCPAYNEESEEMIKTITSMMVNFNYLKNKSPKIGEFSDPDVQREFQNVIPIIVPIFDGTKALSASMKEWILENFPGALHDMEGASQPGTVDVRIVCNKFWYYTGNPSNLSSEVSQRIQRISQVHDSQHNKRLSTVFSNIMQQLSNANLDDDEVTNNKDDIEQQSQQSQHNSNNIISLHSKIQSIWGREVMDFYICPIIKKSNHRKHNSHQWFFDAICEGLEDKVTYAFLTDAGTSYQPQCLSHMLKSLYQMKDLIGVTARQRVDSPNRFFKPCQDSPFSFLVGDHRENVNPCWKCWATFALSPAPLQGFEFEASSIISLAMFNMVEVLPVMPGPCQMLNWQKMKQFQVVDEYFNLLFEGENQKKLPELPHGLRTMNLTTKDMITDVLDIPRVRHSRQLGSSQTITSKSGETITTTSAAITFTEFLRVNMRLAEDRILSFVSVFSTGFGTKWVAGATFYYQPEIQWTTLLTQRRRWINGTFAGYLFYFMSERARSRVQGGLLDVHKPGRSQQFIDAFFGLQVIQMIMVFLCPAVFGVAGYIGLLESAMYNPEYLGFFREPLYGDIRPAEIWIGAYLAILGGWMYLSFTAPKGKMPEWLCQLLCLYGFAFMIPVYYSIWSQIIANGPGLVGSMVILNIALPLVISLAESLECAMMYLLFLPWFVFTALFFLVFMPQYSFARLWDTTWGNRATGKDSAINDRVEDYMKRQNVTFSIGLFIIHVALVWAFSQLFALGFTAIVGFLFIVFAPMLVQMLFSFTYMFIILPIRKTFQFTQNGLAPKKAAAPQGEDLGIDFDEEAIRDVTSGTAFMDPVFAMSTDSNNPLLEIKLSKSADSTYTIPLPKELRPIVAEDATGMPYSTINNMKLNSSSNQSIATSFQRFDSVRTQDYPLPEEEYEQIPLNTPGQRESNRFAVAGRYAKV